MAEDSARPAIATAAEVLAFWCEAGPDRWFIKDDAFDPEIRDKFLATYEAAAGALRDWEATPERPRLVIVLDQFPRNIFRGEARCFATDPRAGTLANAALKRACDYAAITAGFDFRR
jgi:uncharacterized protein (DUF924 family)